MKNNGGKWTTYDRFEVVEIIIDKKRITGLSIKNTKTGAIVYTYGEVKPKKATKKANADVICPKCGKVIQPTKRPNGTIAKPEEVLKGCGMCFECYQASKA